MKFNFLKSIFSDNDGGGSFKRVAFAFLLGLFAFAVFSNVLYGKSLDATLKDQLYYMLFYCLVAIFGEKVIAVFKSKKVIDPTEVKPE